MKKQQTIYLETRSKRPKIFSEMINKQALFWLFILRACLLLKQNWLVQKTTLGCLSFAAEFCTPTKNCRPKKGTDQLNRIHAINLFEISRCLSKACNLGRSFKVWVEIVSLPKLPDVGRNCTIWLPGPTKPTNCSDNFTILLTGPTKPTSQ